MNRLEGSRKPGTAAARHRATDRVIDILELAASSRDGLPLKDLSVRSETPKSSLLPLLRTLSARGYLAQGRTGEYRLGPRALELAVRSRGDRDLVDAARSPLEALMRRTGESAFLTTLAADLAAVVFIDVVESEELIRYTVSVGQRSPLHATANGKTIWSSNLEKSGGPNDSKVFNGGCRGKIQVADACTVGWNYVDTGTPAPLDHAYFLSMRDRSGFDSDSHGQNDRDAHARRVTRYPRWSDAGRGDPEPCVLYGPGTATDGPV